MIPHAWRFFSRFLLLSTLMCSSALLEARPKTDTLVLVNGDSITGEIKSLENGILRYGTDSMGTVSVEWDGVTGVDSNYFFRVRTADGRRYFGAIGRSEEVGRVQVLHAEGTDVIPVMDVVAIVPIESTLDDRLDTVLNAGYSDYKASESRTTNLEATVSYSDEYSVNTFNARHVVSENEDEVNESSRISVSRLRQWEDVRYFSYYAGGWESNDQLAVDSRLTTGIGVGRRFRDDNRVKLSVVGGLQAVTEEDSLGEDTNSLEGLLLLQYRTWSFSDPDLDLVTRVSLFPGITESGRIRSDLDISLSYELIDDFKISLTAFGNFDSDSNEEGDDYDYGITTGISWEL